MTESSMQLLEAKIRAKLDFTIPTTITTFDKWEEAVDGSTDAIMEIIKDHIKEEVNG